MLPARDAHLLQIVEAASADSAFRADSQNPSWIRCTTGCTQCCIGVFPISQLDAERLRHGLSALEHSDPARATALRHRAADAVARLAPEFPGDPLTGILDPQQQERFEDFANDEPCPVLDPATGLCDLYTARPITCRVFGHPLRTAEGIGVCELCFEGATPDEIAGCAIHLDTDALESSLNAQAEDSTGLSGSTLIAWAIAAPVSR